MVEIEALAPDHHSTESEIILNPNVDAPTCVWLQSLFGLRSVVVDMDSQHDQINSYVLRMRNLQEPFTLAVEHEIQYSTRSRVRGCARRNSVHDQIPGHKPMPDRKEADRSG